MISFTKLKSAYDVLQAPFIQVNATVTQPGITNGKPNIVRSNDYIIAPSGKKVATYIVNQIFGSDLVTQTEGLSINWLMPTLKEALELAVYQEESFIYIHKFDNKIYLECIKKTDIHDLIQKFDKIISGTIIQEFQGDDTNYELHRHFEIENGNTYLTMKAFKTNNAGELIPIDLAVFNRDTGNEYLPNYILPYEVIINMDVGEDFFRDSRKFLNEEMEIFNILADELEKTKTRIVTSEHYQSGDIVANWQPASNHYNVRTISVGQLQDYFTLLPSDKDHQLFEFLQGDIRNDNYINTFKFCDYQVIQMAGLSPASFGYEKDAYQNKDSIDLSKNNSDMTIEAIKTQIEPQINKLIENIVKAQQTQGITDNLLPLELSWDYGANEKFTDMKKLQVLGKIESVMSIPYTQRSKIVAPILEKLIDDDYQNNDFLNQLVKENEEEQKKIELQYTEV